MNAEMIAQQIISEIPEHFRCFGAGTVTPGNPISYALKDDSPSFAAGVEVLTVVEFILRRAGELSRSKVKGKSGFHVISLNGSKKLQRLHSELLTAKCKLSSLELTRRTQLVAISTWLNHLKKNGINVQNEQRTENGQQVWYWWIAPERLRGDDIDGNQ